MAQCDTKFPVFYGRSDTKFDQLVAAKPLKRGLTYRISTSGKGAYGGGRFHLNIDGRVQNLTDLHD
jgi:hypothetical protein